MSGLVGKLLAGGLQVVGGMRFAVGGKRLAEVS